MCLLLINEHKLNIYLEFNSYCICLFTSIYRTAEFGPLEKQNVTVLKTQKLFSFTLAVGSIMDFVLMLPSLDFGSS